MADQIIFSLFFFFPGLYYWYWETQCTNDLQSTIQFNEKILTSYNQLPHLFYIQQLDREILDYMDNSSLATQNWTVPMPLWSGTGLELFLGRAWNHGSNRFKTANSKHSNFYLEPDGSINKNF